MKTMESPTKPVFWARLRNSKGFSLIEMAIVLVIIGIIIAAIVKGQDLMVNSRAKQLISTSNAWKIATLAYMDRNGRLPGDSGKNGIIGETATDGTSTAIYEMEAGAMTIPANPIMIGGNAFWFYLGNASVTTGNIVNTIAICKTADCAVGTVLTADEIELLKAVDTAIDGSNDMGSGSFRGAIVDIGFLANTPANTAAGNRADGYFTASIQTSTTANTPWGATAFAGLWAFDKNFK
jgi:prepilin-type N-terminal cleavage/methylation domain-containing protein